MSFDLQPTLRNDHVRLRPLRQDDFDALHTVASDPLIWEQHPDNDRYKVDVFRGFFDGGLASAGALLIFDVTTSAIIGSSRYYGYDADKSEVEIGWTFLVRSHWGGLYNPAVRQLMLYHAFRFVDRVILYAGPENYRSRRAIEKIGGVAEGRRTKPSGQTSIRYVVSRRLHQREPKTG